MSRVMYNNEFQTKENEDKIEPTTAVTQLG